MISLKNSAPSVETLAIDQQPKTSIQANSVERVINLLSVLVSTIDWSSCGERAPQRSRAGRQSQTVSSSCPQSDSGEAAPAEIQMESGERTPRLGRRERMKAGSSPGLTRRGRAEVGKGFPEGAEGRRGATGTEGSPPVSQSRLKHRRTRHLRTGDDTSGNRSRQERPACPCRCRKKCPRLVCRGVPGVLAQREAFRAGSIPPRLRNSTAGGGQTTR